MIYLFTGLIIGFFVALPVGAAALLCINRSIQYGFKAGIFTGLGVATADLVYGFFCSIWAFCNFRRDIRKSASFKVSRSILYHVYWFENDDQSSTYKF